jgi:hypothetical protein
MNSQTFSGKPKTCRNRNCRAPFTKESHLGFMEKSETEALAVMRCPKCKDTFAVSQFFSEVHEYRESLPSSSASERGSGDPISYDDIRKVRQVFGEGNPLKTLFEGHKPGSSIPRE